MQILIVEDNHSLSENMQQFLSGEGNVCKQAFSQDEALDELLTGSYDIVILDIMLPDGTGLEVLHYLQEQQIDSGVLIVSAKNSLDDRLQGLDMGADDYLTKPFHLSELNARLKAIYRRKRFNGNQRIIFNEIQIDLDHVEVLIHDELVNLTRKEYDLLLYFLANKNRMLTKQSIAEHLWGSQVDLYDSFDFVYQHIKNLRRKITKAGGKDYIATVYGFGYKFNTRIA